MDLVVRPGPGVPGGLVIPEGELVERFSRSSGPGGQSVNTTDSRVELSFDPSTSRVLDERQRDALGGTPLTVVASEHRSQHRNRISAGSASATWCATGWHRLPSRGFRRSRRAARSGAGWTRRSGGVRTKALRGRVRD